MPENIDVDVAVVGAGIAGAGVAAAIADDFRVAIIEMEDRPGYHTTGRSAAIFIQNYGGDVIRALSRASAPLFASADPILFPAPLLSPRGVLTIATADDRHKHSASLENAEGLREISVAEAVAMAPILREDRMVAATYEAAAQDIDVAGLHQGWLRQARTAGALLLTGTPVRGARRINKRWEIDTKAGVVTAATAVNAAGAWADVVARLFGVAPIGLTPMRRSMAVLPAPAGFDTRNWPLIGDVGESWYAKPDGGRLLVSPADEDPAEPHDAFVDDMVLAAGLDRFGQAVTMPVTRVERSWAGLRTFAPDRTPVAGFDAAVEGFFWLAGQGGYGIQTAPALSRLAGQLIRRVSLTTDMEAIVPALSPNRLRIHRQQ